MATTKSIQHSMNYIEFARILTLHFLEKEVCSYVWKDNSIENEEDENCTNIKYNKEFVLIGSLPYLENCKKQKDPSIADIRLQKEKSQQDVLIFPPSVSTDISAETVTLREKAAQSPELSEYCQMVSYMQEMVMHPEAHSHDIHEFSESKKEIAAHHDGYSCYLPVSSELKLLYGELSERADEDFSQFCSKKTAMEHVSSALTHTYVLPVSNTLYGLPLCESMRWEVWRLSTFANVKHLAPFAIRMAQSGFYYDSGLKDIRCFSCGVTKSDWTRSDKPALVHLDISPLCAHANFRDDTNIPLDSKSSTLLPTETITVSGANEVAMDSEQGNGSSTSESASLEPPSSVSKSSQNNVGDASGPGGFAESNKGELVQSEVVSESLVNNSKLALENVSCASSHPNLLQKREKDLPVDGVAKAKEFSYQTDLVVYHVTSSSQPVDVVQIRNPVQAEHPHDDTERQSGSRSRADNLNNIPSIDSQYTIVEEVLRNLNLARAAYPSYVGKKARLLSYEAWMIGSIQNPLTLTDCGFYYLGTKDSVRCFYCGVTVRNWRSSDDPWVVHVLFRFSCEYVIAVKGDEFIRQILIQKGIGARQNAIISDQARGSPNADESNTDPVRISNTQDDASGAAPHSPAPAVNDVGTPIASAHSQQSSDNSRVSVPSQSPASSDNSRVSVPSQSPASQTPSRRSTSVGKKASISAQVDGVNKSSPTKGASTPHIASLITSAVHTLSSLVRGSHSLLEPLAVFQNSMPSAFGSGPHSLQTDSVLEPSQSNTTAVDPAAVSPPLGAKPMGRDQRSTLSQDSATQGNPLVYPDNDGGRLRYEQMADANHRLRDQRTCKICRNSTVDTIFLPCGHLCTCSACASTIRYCCLCNDEIKGTAHVYLE